MAGGMPEIFGGERLDERVWSDFIVKCCLKTEPRGMSRQKRCFLLWQRLTVEQMESKTNKNSGLEMNDSTTHKGE